MQTENNCQTLELCDVVYQVDLIPLEKREMHSSNWCMMGIRAFFTGPWTYELWINNVPQFSESVGSPIKDCGRLKEMTVHCL